ncbi:WD40 repeat domain-containing protein [Nocardia jejuensis]|uniref:WD40 repeat domain-containing protein n=1 Tax=Nocardia jejuensis TaxID=328049 RepID=UPI00082E8209|nr:WD40 repeat domain-containing protein [Nocardia jejuensis]
MVFTERFGQLYAAAGNPKLTRLAENARTRFPAGTRPQGASMQRISDWRAGRNVPAKWESFHPVLLTLIEAARTAAEPCPPELLDVRQWKRLWTSCTTDRPTLAVSVGCPYPGLTRYGRADAELFSGRDTATAELRELVHTTTGIIALVGASGAGKSSLLHAGLIPGLLADAWEVQVLTPARTSEQTLRDLHWDGERRLLVIDQFEELFTAHTDEHDRNSYVAALHALTAAEQAVTLVLAIRADFYARCMDHPVLLAALRDRSYLLGAMTREELGRAVARPAEISGLSLEPGLRELVISELCDMDHGSEHQGYDPGLLPLLSHVMAATWERREGRRLTVAGYRQAGGISGSVAATAEHAWTALSIPQQAAAHRILSALVNVGRDSKDTRRIVRLTDLPDSDDGAGGAALEVLARSRLVTLDTESAYLTHEIVLDAWPRLRAWIDEDRIGYVERQRLDLDAAEWAASERDPSRLYPAPRLAIAREHAERGPVSATAGEFLTAATQARTRDLRRTRSLRAAAAAAVVILLAVSSIAYFQNRLAQQRETDKLIAELLTDADGLGDTNPSLAAQLVLIADKMRPADPAIQARVLRTQTLPLATPLRGHEDSITDVAVDPRGTLIASAGADRTVRLWSMTGEPRAVATLAQQDAPVTSVAFSPSGEILAVGTLSGSVRLWSMARPERPEPLGSAFVSGSGGVRLAFSPDRRTLAAASADHTVTLWNVATPAAPNRGPLLRTDAPVRSLAFSPTGNRLITASNTASEPTHYRSAPEPPVTSQVLVWSLDSTAAPMNIPVEDTTHRVDAVAFSPDGTTVALGHGGATVDIGSFAEAGVRLWSIADATPRPLGPTVPLSIRSGIWALAFSPDSHTLAIADDEGALLWNVSDPARPVPYGSALRSGATACPDPTGACRTGSQSLAFAPDGRHLVTGDATGIVQLWSPAPGFVNGLTSDLVPASLDESGQRMVTGWDDGELRLWDLSNPTEPRRLGAMVGGAGDISADGRRMIAMPRGTHPPVHLIDISDPDHFRVLHEFPDAIAAGFMDGDRMATLSGPYDDTTWQMEKVRYWDISDPEHPRLLGTPLADRPFTDGALAALTNNDGSLIFALGRDRLPSGGTQNVAALWQVTDPSGAREVRRIPSPPAAPIYSITIGRDNRTLVTMTRKAIQLWDISDHDRLTELSAIAPPDGMLTTTVDITPDGRRMVIGGNDGSIRLYDVENRSAPKPLGPSLVSPKAITGDAYATLVPSRGLVLGVGLRSQLVVLDLDPAEAVERVCRVTRDVLTPEVWHAHLPDRAYDPPC